MEKTLDKREKICYSYGEVIYLKDKNVSRFIPEAAPSELKTHQFIFESNAKSQAKGCTLPYQRMFLISRGEGMFRIDTESLPVSVGDMIFAFPGETVAATGTDLEYFYIAFEGQRAGEFNRRFGVSGLRRKFSGHEGLLPFWRENISRATDENADIISESVLLHAFSKLTNIQDTAFDIPHMMAAYAEENFAEADLSLQTLGDEWGYHPKYLSDAFKKRMGIGFSVYVKNLRIKHAVFLMDHGVESVKNVAFLCGFRDPLYFSKVFREDMGISPSEYRKRKP
jgi:AraC-like DNA-binding protein